MTLTTPTPRPSRGRRLAIAVGGAVLAAGGLGAGLALSLSGTPSSPENAAAVSFNYYRSVVGTSGPGGMMDGSGGFGSPSWMMGRDGYAWMMGGTAAPGWMRGGNLPSSVAGGDTDPGSVMGKLFANAPGTRVSPAEATRLGAAVPPGARANRAARRLSFSTKAVHLAVVASPSMPNENFRIAGMTNPTIVVPKGATVSIAFINADADMAHGLVVTAAGAASSWMPMMSAPPAFPGAALWFLGESTSAGMHAGTLSFGASVPGSYRYLCPVPGHADEGMVGRFVVSPVR